MAEVHRLFFAVRPDAAAASAAAALADALRARHGLTGRPLARERLHVTLHFLGDHAELPPELVDGARAAGRGVETAPFEVVFDRAESFGRGRRGGPLVLTGSAGNPRLCRFREELGAAMTTAGIGQDTRRDFRPHLTLLYDERPVAPQAVAPIRWAVQELLLVHSLVGRSRHTVLDRWPLRRSG